MFEAEETPARENLARRQWVTFFRVKLTRQWCVHVPGTGGRSGHLRLTAGD
jgi:hypothetical protein